MDYLQSMILVFVRKRDVQKKNFAIIKAPKKESKKGRNLVVARASNKGGVGLSFRYYDTTIAVVGCHLASDSKGRNRNEKRLEQCRELLQDVVLLPLENDTNFDLQYHHHHVLVMGDMNFRIRPDSSALSSSSFLLQKSSATFVVPPSEFCA